MKHKEFTLYTNNEASSWVLQHVKELGRVGCWMLRLDPFKFKVCHTPGKTNVVADCLTGQYEAVPSEKTFSGLISHLLVAFQSVRQHKLKDPYC